MSSLCVIFVLLVSCSWLRAQTDDHSFYQTIDKKDWPGDSLSEKQVLRAIQHFQDPATCHKPWRWALIGPDTFLLKGTDYLVHRRIDAETPNIGYSKGYWGGVPFYNPIPSVQKVKNLVEVFATDDCKYH